MKKQQLLFMSLTLLTIYSCSKNTGTPENSEKIKYALSVTGGTFPDQTTYVFGTKDFPSGTVGTSNALELASQGTMYKYGSDIFVSTFGAPATLRKFNFDEATGKPVQSASFSVPGLKTFGAVTFISATEAYAASNGFGGIPQLIKFNPGNMQTSGTIDLNGIEKKDATEIYYLGLVSRGDYLYMGVNYQDASFSNLADSVFVAVINKTTSKLEKVIADGRSSEMWNGGTENSFSPNVLIKDANDDIYVTGCANNGKPSGILKINKGDTEFDPTYFFDLNAATGKPCLGLFHFGNGLTFTIRYADEIAYPFDTDANYNPLAAAEYYKIDLASKTSAGNISPSLPKFFGNAGFMTKWDNEKIYFNVAGSTSNAIYSYKISGNTVFKEFDLSAACNGFTKIQ